MEWNKLKLKLGDWAERIKPFYDNGGFEPIFSHLKQLKQQEGIEISPSAFCLFRAFKQTKLSELTCVIIGENPFNTFKNDVSIDTGILFETNIGIQPILQEFYNGIENELYNGLNLDVIYDDQLEYLSSQGVLMIPSSLTIEKNADKGHNKLWNPFMEFLLLNVIGYTGVPILFLGRSKQYMHLVEQSNYCYHLELPNFGNKWKTNNVFSKINEHIWETNKDTIMWIKIENPF